MCSTILQRVNLDFCLPNLKLKNFYCIQIIYAKPPLKVTRPTQFILIFIKHSTVFPPTSLAFYWIIVTFWNWFNYYLNNQSQRVKIFNAISDALQMLPDVPQGSILGPLHFFDPHKWFITDHSIFLFADNAKLGKIIFHPTDHFYSQQDLDQLYILGA